MSLTLLSFKTRTWLWPSVLTATTSFPGVIFQLLQFSRHRPSFSAHRAALMSKTVAIFPALSSRFIDFAIQFYFRCKCSFHEKRRSSLTVVWFSWTNHNSLLRIAINEIASFCFDNRLRQMAFFVITKVGKGRLSSYVERFWKKTCFFLLYKTNIFHVAVRLFSNRSQKTLKSGKNISDTIGYRLVCHLFVLTTFWKEARQHGICLLN